MNIAFATNNRIPYERLDFGDVFMHEGNVFLFTNEPEEGEAGEYLSVCVTDGKMMTFGKKVEVNKIDKATLVLG